MPEIKNIEFLTNIFGRFPSFHDAEILEIKLNREYNGKCAAALQALIHTWAITSEVAADRKLLLKNHCHVHFTFVDIFGLLLENFNIQNVISGLNIRPIKDVDLERPGGSDRLMGLVSKEQLENLNFYVKFEYCYGVEAEFLCHEVVVERVEMLEN